LNKKLYYGANITFRILVKIIQGYEPERRRWIFCLEPELKLKISRSRRSV